MTRFRQLYFLPVSLVVGASTVSADPSELLAIIRAKMSANLKQLPDYTCQETVSRFVRWPRKQKFEVYDLLTLDVAYLSGREILATPGSASFEIRRIREVVPRGAMGTGAFAGIAQAIFTGTAATIRYQGRAWRNQHAEVHFGFDIPQVKSVFVVHRGDRAAVVANHGWFAADENTLDLVEIQDDEDDIPPRIEIIRLKQRVEYARTRIAGSDFLLPVSSNLTIYDRAGSVEHNHTVFEKCRQFKGESTLSF